MTNEDRATSYRVLRYRLFLGGHTNTLDADEETLRRALLAIPHSIEALCQTVGADGVWAAQNVLGMPQPPLTLTQAKNELVAQFLAAVRPIVIPVLDWLVRQLDRLTRRA
jgi:hypothetical protein